RRRHTSFSHDWSSDVCSSDLLGLAASLVLAFGVAWQLREPPVPGQALPAAAPAAAARSAPAAAQAVHAPAAEEAAPAADAGAARSEERRVGKGCQARWRGEPG